MHRMHADNGAGDDGQQDGGHDHDQRSHVHEAAQQQQQRVDQEQQQVLVAGDREQCPCDLVRDAQRSHHVGKGLGGGDQGHHDSQRLERAAQDVVEVAQLRRSGK